MGCGTARRHRHKIATASAGCGNRTPLVRKERVMTPDGAPAHLPKHRRAAAWQTGTGRQTGVWTLGSGSAITPLIFRQIIAVTSFPRPLSGVTASTGRDTENRAWRTARVATREARAGMAQILL